MDSIPIYLSIGFILLTLITILYFYWISQKNKAFLFFTLGWAVLHSIIAWKGFYSNFEVIPPRFLIMVIPALILIIIFGLTKIGASFRATIDLEKLHYIHLVRIFIESIFLYRLFRYGAMAQETTFAGNNFDIISGITTPLIIWLYFRKQLISKNVLLTWNIAALLILSFTVSQVVLSAPLPFQKLSFDQASIAVFYFPFILLPGIIVPLVILTHFISIKEIIRP